MNVRDIRMVQDASVCFAGEPGESVGVAGECVWQDLERDLTIQFRVAGTVDRPIPPSPMCATIS